MQQKGYTTRRHRRFVVHRHRNHAVKPEPRHGRLRSKPRSIRATRMPSARPPGAFSTSPRGRAPTTCQWSTTDHEDMCPTSADKRPWMHMGRPSLSDHPASPTFTCLCTVAFNAIMNTLHPNPWSLNPDPQTLNLYPKTLNSKPSKLFTRNPKHRTLNPKNPKPSTLNP